MELLKALSADEYGIDSVDVANEPSFDWGNFLGKAVDTALDVYTIQQTGARAGSAPKLGSVYPTGQTDPAVARTQTQAGFVPAGQTQFPTNTIVIGAIAIGAVVVLALVLKK